MFWSLPPSSAIEKQRPAHNGRGSCPPLTSSTSADAAYFRSDGLRSNMTGSPKMGTGNGRNSGGLHGADNPLLGNIVGAAKGLEDRRGLFGERHR